MSFSLSRFFSSTDTSRSNRYDNLTTRNCLSHDPLFRWCIAPGCTSGQIQVPDGGPAFVCVACGFKHCVHHMVEWHHGETCEKYEYRISGQKKKDEARKKRQAEEEASRLLMETTTKRCPGPKGKTCGWGIEKNDGCDHMTCKSSPTCTGWVCGCVSAGSGEIYSSVRVRIGVADSGAVTQVANADISFAGSVWRTTKRSGRQVTQRMRWTASIIRTTCTRIRAFFKGASKDQGEHKIEC